MLTDQYGRTFSYIRLSLTEACNFRCQYCLPNGFCGDKNAPGPLSLTEIEHLVEALSELGVRKIRLTGGEPALRPDLLSIIASIAAKPSVEVLAMTTNGFRLNERIESYRAAGLNHLNVSLDSVRPESFLELSGKNSCNKIMAAIDKALKLNFRAVKVNTVLMRDYSFCEYREFLEWIKTRPINLRFIELMQTTDNLSFFKKQHIRAGQLKDTLLADGWKPVKPGKFSGPSQDLGHPDFAGQVGFIAPYDKSFCTTCNRLRITAKGELRLCLFGDKNHDLRPLLQSESQKSALMDRIHDLLEIKQKSHHLHEGNNGSTRHFAAIGG